MLSKIAFCVGFIFFIIGLFTLTSYGINWDTINHLPRGQAYLHFFLTGKKDYSDLPKLFNDWSNPNDWYFQNPKSLGIDTNLPFNKVPTRSLYQISSADFNYFMQTDGDGHPPLSDIIEAAFNRVFFGKLRIINDIDSYRVYGVLLAAALVGLVFWWGTKMYGKLAGFISASILACYPLFFSEMHFNTEKDIPETVYWSFMFFCVWKGITERKVKWILLSGVFFGLALGTKFNILFAVIALIPWIIFSFVRRRENVLSKINIKIYIAAFFSFLIGLVIFVSSWPYLWPDPLGRVGKVINFYKGIGISTTLPDVRFIGPFGTNTLSIQWIIYTTPIIVLIFLAIGIITSLLRIRKEKDLISILFLFWFLVPIARVTWSGADTYGGIRQIMEYIPAMAMLAGLGASSLINTAKKIKVGYKFVYAIVVFIILLIPIFKTHPNENVYFNSLIGGLSGAKIRNFPYWGFSFGAAYRQGIEWINDNAPKNASVVYAYELIPNIPRLWIRPDLNLQNINRSGYLRNGEFAITLTYQGTDTRSYYDNYLEKFIKPSFEVVSDNTAILKVWENDNKHLVKPIDEKIVQDAKLIKAKNGITFDLGNTYSLSRVEVNYNDSKCPALVTGYDQISTNGNDWTRLPGAFPDDWRISYLGQQPDKGHFIEPFVGQEARFINFSLDPLNTCLTQVKNFKVYYFQ